MCADMTRFVPSLVVCQDCGGAPWLLRPTCWSGLVVGNAHAARKSGQGPGMNPNLRGGGDAKTYMYQNDYAQLVHICASPDSERAQHLVSP
jgi:hypothetical protein